MRKRKLAKARKRMRAAVCSAGFGLFVLIGRLLNGDD